MTLTAGLQTLLVWQFGSKFSHSKYNNKGRHCWKSMWVKAFFSVFLMLFDCH